MSTALWFGQPVEVIDYGTDPDVGQVARVRTASGDVRRVPVYDLEEEGDTATQHTARIVAALESALTDAGHEVDVPTSPTVADLDRLCRLLGVKVSDLVSRVEAVGCPAWCMGTHPVNDPAHHVAVIHARSEITLSLTQGLGQEVAIFVPDDVDEGLTPERARHLAAALTMAADAADEGGQS